MIELATHIASFVVGFLTGRWFAGSEGKIIACLKALFIR
jgi:hypothetical protein